MPGTPNVDADGCAMTAPDDHLDEQAAEQPAETMPDLLAALQESVDRARGRRTGPIGTELHESIERAAGLDALRAELGAVRAEADAPPAHPAGYTVEQALAYVDDTPELRTPAERTLAREYNALRAAYASSIRRQAEQDAELLVLRDLADRLDRDLREQGNDLGRHMLYATPVLEAWRRLDPDTGAGQVARCRAQVALGAQFVADLDELAGVA